MATPSPRKDPRASRARHLAGATRRDRRGDRRAHLLRQRLLRQRPPASALARPDRRRLRSRSRPRPRPRSPPTRRPLRARYALNGPMCCGETMVLSTTVSQEHATVSLSLLDCAGRRRSPATLASFHPGRAPQNKGLCYPPDPPTVEEDRRRHAGRGRAPGSDQAARCDRRAVACWPAVQRSTRASRERSRPIPRHGSRPARQRRQAESEVGMDRWGKRRDKPAWRRR